MNNALLDNELMALEEQTIKATRVMKRVHDSVVNLPINKNF